MCIGIDKCVCLKCCGNNPPLAPFLSVLPLNSKQNGSLIRDNLRLKGKVALAHISNFRCNVPSPKKEDNSRIQLSVGSNFSLKGCYSRDLLLSVKEMTNQCTNPLNSNPPTGTTVALPKCCKTTDLLLLITLFARGALLRTHAHAGEVQHVPGSQGPGLLRGEKGDQQARLT